MRNPEVFSPPTPTLPFEAALNRAVHIAALSPSSHNCQPWALAHLAGPEARAAAATLLRDEATGDCHYLALALDRGHQLSALPAHGLEMLLSCGLYGQLLIRALAAHGWTLAQATILGHESPSLSRDWPEQWTALCILKFAPGGEPKESITELAAVADARRTNRGPYRDEPLDATLLHALDAPGIALSADADVKVSHLSTAEDRARFAGLLVRHAGRDFSDLAAWRETHSYIRTPRQAAEQGDGFTLAQLFGPMRPARRRFMELALAPGTMRALRHLGYPRLLAGQLAAVARDTPVISILHLPAETLPAETLAASDLLRAGAYLTDYWLRVTRSGLAMHPLSVLLQHEDARRDLQTQFDLPGRAFFVARLGRPAMAFPRTARRASAAACREL